MVIDELVLQLGLDPREFNKGQKEALEAFKKTQEAAVRGGKEIEEQSRKSFAALGGIKTQALELFAVFTGGKGVIDFVTHSIQANAQLGRMSRNIGVSVAEINRWQGAARIMGGDAASMAQSFVFLTDAIEGFKIGQVSPLIAEFRALGAAGGTVIDMNKGVNDTLLDIAANLKAIHDSGPDGPARAGLLGRRMGLDPALFDLLVQGRDATQSMLDKVQRLAPATEQATDEATKLAQKWNAIRVAADGAGRGIAKQAIEASDWLNLPVGQALSRLMERDSWAWLLGHSKATPRGTSIKTGAFTSQAEKEAFIRGEARKQGISESDAMRVARSEGFNNPIGDNGTSFGAFQLHVTPGGRGQAVGDQFRKATGLDPSDRANERATIAFALQWAKTHGWGDFHGAGRVGMSRWQGITPGAGLSAAVNAGGTTNVNNTTSINGPITINAGPNADGRKIASDLRAEILKRQQFTAQADYGQQ